MAQTVFGTNDPKTQKKWSSALAVDVAATSYFGKKFVGTSDNSVIQRKTDLETSPGDKISFDLCIQLRQEPTEGDNTLEDNEEKLKFYTDEVYIDQSRHAVSAGGRMTRKRTSHNLREVARNRLSDYWALFMDQMMFIYLSGARGINQDFIVSTSWTGRAGNSLLAPDTDHLMYPGAVTSKASMTASDKMTRVLIEKANTKAKMMQAVDRDNANMVPVSIEGEDRYVILMSEFQAYDLKTGTGTSEWVDIQKAAAGAEGSNNRLFKGGLGMIGNSVLHAHRNSIRFADYGAGSNVEAARALMLGRQAGVCAYGSTKGNSWTWKEKMRDYENEPTVAAGSIFGFKKTRFNSRDFGVISIDTAAADPNA